MKEFLKALLNLFHCMQVYSKKVNNYNMETSLKKYWDILNVHFKNIRDPDLLQLLGEITVEFGNKYFSMAQ